jgi:hypothetical protein
MGLQQSKEELLYQQVNYGNIEGIRTLKAQGAGVEARITISISISPFHIPLFYL